MVEREGAALVRGTAVGVDNYRIAVAALADDRDWLFKRQRVFGVGAVADVDGRGIRAAVDRRVRLGYRLANGGERRTLRSGVAVAARLGDVVVGGLGRG